MGNITDFVKKTFDLADEDVKGLAFAESAIKAISGFVDAVNTTKTILIALGLFQKTDDVAAAVQALEAAFDDAILRSDEHSTMKDVANVIGPAKTALDDLHDLAPDDPLAVGDVNWQAVRSHTLDAPPDALNTLEEDAYWKRLFFPEAVYKDAWAGQPYTPPHNGYVFDYRYTLPAYIEVITIWLITRSAMVRFWRNQFKAEFKNRAKFLEDKLSQIRNGIVMLDPPRFGQAEVVDGSSVWNDRGRLFGTVEVYSTFRIIDSWPEHEYPLHNTDYIRFVIRHQIRTLARWKQVYKQVGLAALARIVVQLKALGGVSPATIDGSTEDWSVRELAQRLAALAQWLAADPARAGLDRRELAQTFADIPGSGFASGQSISLRKVLQVLQTFSPEPYTSLRAALAQ